ncbi:hypothetical protein ACQ27_gp092 [Klebsiella phage K64-1]|nr:hypothetical protein ACQ27_gp092 [Klebsiella phage K64-1]
MNHTFRVQINRVTNGDALYFTIRHISCIIFNYNTIDLNFNDI